MENEWDGKMKSKQRKREALCFSDMMKMDKKLFCNVAEKEPGWLTSSIYKKTNSQK